MAEAGRPRGSASVGEDYGTIGANRPLPLPYARGEEDEGERFNPPGEDRRVLPSVAIFGHSYVRRLYLDRPLYHPQFYVSRFAKGGARLDNICEGPVWEGLLAHKPELTFLVIGGNDVQVGADLAKIAQDIEDLAKVIEDGCKGHCLIVGIESRTHPRGMSAEAYNRAKNGVNRRLKRVSQFARSRYFSMEMCKDELCPDGVHLDIGGSERLFKLIIKKATEYFDSVGK